MKKIFLLISLSLPVLLGAMELPKEIGEKGLREGEGQERRNKFKIEFFEIISDDLKKVLLQNHLFMQLINDQSISIKELVEKLINFSKISRQFKVLIVPVILILKNLCNQCNLNKNESLIWNLVEAGANNKLETVKAILLQLPIDPNKISLKHCGLNVLHEACRYGYFEIAVFLLSLPNINPNERAENLAQNVPLHFAVAFNDTKIVEKLLKHPLIDPNLRTIQIGTSSMGLAIEKGYIDIVLLLLANNNTDVNASFGAPQNGFKYSFLHAAIYFNRIDIVKLLLVHPNIKIDLKFDAKISVLEMVFVEALKALKTNNLDDYSIFIDILNLLIHNNKIIAEFLKKEEDLKQSLEKLNYLLRQEQPDKLKIKLRQISDYLDFMKRML